MYLHSRDYCRFAYDRHPHVIEYGCNAASASTNAVRVYRHLGRSEEAVGEARKAVELCRRMVRSTRPPRP